MASKNRFDISIRIDDQRDLYNNFDNRNETLSSDLVDYILNKILISDIEDGVSIDIVSNIHIDIDKFKYAFKKSVENEIDIVEKEIKYNKKRAFGSTGVGIVFLIIYFILCINIDYPILEIISLIGSFAVWEGFGLYLFDTKELEREREKYRILKDSYIYINGVLINNYK